MNAKQHYELALTLFQKKRGMDQLWQEISDNFYPERAEFTSGRSLGDEFASNLLTSYPVLVRRDLGDQIGSMLRPAGRDWFSIKPTDPDREDHEAKVWLERATKIQRRAMYDRAAKLDAATKLADHDFAAFGQCVISSEIVYSNTNGPHLLHRTWHLRDMAWQNNLFGDVGDRYRKWKVSARDLAALFPGKIHPNVERMAKGTDSKAITEMDCMHMIIEADHYDMDKAKLKDRPWVSVYYDCMNKHVIEEVATFNPYYIIPRWQTYGSQYAYSPAAIVGLPDARLIQSMSRTLLEAGEKATNPPMIATDEVVRSDVSIYAGGVTWVDRDYDERLGAALRPMTIDTHGIPFGQDMMRDTQMILHNAFYLNKLTLPQRGPDMTAYEVGQRVQQYIRDALPLFGPMEADYNGQLCDLDFELLHRAGAFGSPFDMPKSLQGASTDFVFMSPLHDAIEAVKTQKFLEMQQLVTAAMQIDKDAIAVPDASIALRDALHGAGIPTNWTRSAETVKQMREQQKRDEEQQVMLDQMLQGSQAVRNLGGAAKEAAFADIA